MDLLLIFIFIFILSLSAPKDILTRPSTLFANTPKVDVSQIPIRRNPAGILDNRAFFKIYDKYKIEGRIINP